MKHSLRLGQLVLPLFTALMLNSGVLQAQQLKIIAVVPWIGEHTMVVSWVNSPGATETVARRKEEGGQWTEWFKQPGNQFMDNTVDEGKKYYYQLRELVNGVWSDTSNIKGNGFKRLWPVLKPGTSEPSREVLHGFGEGLKAKGKEYFHEGVDINGVQNTDNEFVRAPVGGIVNSAGGTGDNIGIHITASINGKVYMVELNHLLYIDEAVKVGESIEEGQIIGKIVSGVTWHTQSNHTHFGFWPYDNEVAGEVLNPFTFFTDPEDRDPQGMAPILKDVTNDGKDIKYRKTPDSDEYYEENEVHNAVDFEVEAVDLQSVDVPYANPGLVGYFVEREVKGKWVPAVKDRSKPYVVFDSKTFYKSSFAQPNSEFVKKIITFTPETKSRPDATPPGYDWEQWFTYTVTNTKGEKGQIEEIDDKQCFATDARKTVNTPNGYVSNYAQARIIDEAKFPDGKYRVGIILRDLEHSSSDFRNFKVDNFRPYAKVVKIEGGALKYKATWNWNEGNNQLILDEENNKKKACGTIKIRITMSEPMKDVSVEVPSLGYKENSSTAVGGSDNTIFEFEIPAELTKDGPEGPHKLEIDGHDMNDNGLQGFTDKGAKSGDVMDQRQLDGTWLPGGVTKKDNIHEFKLVDLEIEVKTTPPTDCSKKNGTATINVTGDDGPFEYSVDGSKFQASNTFKNLGGGKHTAVVRKSETECEFPKEFVIEDNSLQVEIAGLGTIQFCEDEHPSITLSAMASGGSGDYAYSWPGGVKTVSSSGYYSVTVTDKVYGCKKTVGGQVTFVPIVCSRDPNDIVGPEGYGAAKMIAKSKSHSYMVRFENDPKFASAPAQVVKINHPLDNNVNLFSLRLGDFGFAGMNFQVPADKTFYSTRLNVMDSLGVVVDVTAGIDVDKREVFWVFESKDPATGLPPANAMLGFLPINDTAGRGEGFVTYTVKAASQTKTGDSIHAKASIVFDVNAPIETPVIYNAIDALAPVSKVKAMPAVSNTPAFRVSWEGADDAGGSGVHDYVLYVSENGNAYKPVQPAAADTALTYTGITGNTYRFFVLATDNTGNVEGMKSAAEATVKVGNDCKEEVCNGVDDDCDGEVDEGFIVTYYRDADGDGFGSPSNTKQGTTCLIPAGYVTSNTDCDDSNAAIHPGAAEVCGNQKDDDCDGLIDEGCGLQRYYIDADKDGFGRDGGSVLSAVPILGRVLVGGDCMDWEPSVYPGAPEVADGRDNNCNGQVDEGLPLTRYYIDADKDGFGRESGSKLSAIPIPRMVTVAGDCIDWDATVYPGAPELADGKDNNCNGQVDEGLLLTRYYIDADKDGFGREGGSQLSAIPIPGMVLVAGDCIDWDNTVYPGAPELADGKDNNCDGQIDDGLVKQWYYQDVDRDGFGRDRGAILSASPIPGYVTKGGDCHDYDATIYPGAPELKDGKDNNCNGAIDEQPIITITETVKGNTTTAQEEVVTAGELAVVVTPVPSYYDFTIQLKQGDAKQQVTLRVFDQVGRVLEVKDNLFVGARIQIGAQYARGYYTLEVVQGKTRKLIKLIKL